MLIKPVRFKNNVVITDIGDIELNVLFMICRVIVVIDANALEGKVCNIAHDIFQVIYVASRE